MTIIEKLKNLREASKYTQSQIAKFLGVDQTTLSKFESGDRKLSLLQAEKLALLYGYDLVSLGRVDNIAPNVHIAFRASEISDDDLAAIADINRILINLKQMNHIEEISTNGN